MIPLLLALLSFHPAHADTSAVATPPPAMTAYESTMVQLRKREIVADSVMRERAIWTDSIHSNQSLVLRTREVQNQQWIGVAPIVAAALSPIIAGVLTWMVTYWQGRRQARRTEREMLERTFDRERGVLLDQEQDLAMRRSALNSLGVLIDSKVGEAGEPYPFRDTVVGLFLDVVRVEPDESLKTVIEDQIRMRRASALLPLVKHFRNQYPISQDGHTIRTRQLEDLEDPQFYEFCRDLLAELFRSVDVGVLRASLSPLRYLSLAPRFRRILFGIYRHRTPAWLNEYGLSGVLLYNAHLEGSSIAGANVMRAYFRQSKLNGVDFRFALARSANLDEVWAPESRFMGADLRGCWARDANFHAASFELARMNHAELRDAHFSDAVLRRVDFTGANLSKACMWRADLRRTKLLRANLTEADLTDANVRWASFEAAELHEADLRRLTGWEKADWTGANWWEADMTDDQKAWFQQHYPRPT